MVFKDHQTDFGDWKRNFSLLILDVAFYSSAISFADASIISVFVIKATGSIFLVGLLQMLRTAFFFIPQILSMNISGKTNKISILKWTSLGRSCLIIASLAALLTDDLTIITVSFFISLTLFHLCDGFTIVPWLDLITQSIPPYRRGTFFGVSGFVGSSVQVISGVIISRVLENSALIFPKNYGTLILIELVIMICGLPAIFFVKEKEDDEDQSEPESLMTIIRKIPTIIREDTMIKMLIITQLLISFYSLATPFYSVYTLSTLGLKDTIVGYFLSAQMFGRLAFSFLWAHFCNTGRHQQIIQLTSVLYLTSLFLMLILGLVSLPEEVVTYGVIASFTLTGAAMNGMWIGSNTYIMETSKMDRRPILLGFLNSLNVLTSILTLLGGYMLGYLSYEVIFLLAIIPLSISLLIVSNLRKKII